MDLEADIPESWKTRFVRDVGEVVTGRTPSTKREDFYGGDYNLISPADLDNGKYVFTAHKRLSRTGFGECRALPKDTVLVGCIGNVGKLGMVTNDKSATNQQINAVICNPDNDPHFIYYCLYAGRGRLERAADKTTVPILNKTNFENFQVVVPPLPEQRKISAVLGLVQRAMEQQEQLLALTAELKKTLLHQLFTHGLRGEPQKQTEIGLVPESWEQRPLEQAGEVVYGIQAAVASNLKPVGTKILTNKNITLDGKIVVDAINYFVLKTKRHHEAMLKKGDLLFNWRSGSKEHVGKTAYFDLDGEFTHSSFILRIRPNDEVTGRYLFYYLNFLRESGYFVKAQTFSINAKFNKSAINRLPTYLPGEEERRDIVAALDRCL
jgi:type I restriction enzyme S subunit